MMASMLAETRLVYDQKKGLKAVGSCYNVDYFKVVKHKNKYLPTMTSSMLLHFPQMT
jgi:hypothetical protein